MKKTLLFGALGALCLSAGILTVTSLSAKEQISDLTLANIEAMTAICNDRIDISGAVITVTVCNRTTSVAGYIGNIPCNASSSSKCSFSNVSKI